LKVLLDECTPRVLKSRLRSHEVHTVQDMGWAGVKNGALLDLAEERVFEALVTTDQSLRHQQNISARNFGVIVLSSNEVPVVLRLLPAIEEALSTLMPGAVKEISLSP
jgi:hypothetical protein